MLVPVTAHAAFDKAAELLGMRIRLEVQYNLNPDQDEEVQYSGTCQWTR